MKKMNGRSTRHKAALLVLFLSSCAEGPAGGPITTPTGCGADGGQPCELALDPACLGGEHAAQDPLRHEACTMLAYINADRARFSAESGGAPALAWDEALWLVAVSHSQDMCARQYFSHVTPEGRTPWQRAADAGTSATAENIAKTFGPGQAHWGFMAEPTCTGHRGNILHRSATHVGIGYVSCKVEECVSDQLCTELHYVTEDFRASCAGVCPNSPFCVDPHTSCEIPPDPPTVAPCVAGACSNCCLTPGDETLEAWDCPAD